VRDSNLFLWTRTWPDKITEEHLRQLELLHIPTVSFHLDKYAGIKRDGGLGISSPFWHTDYVFSPEGSIESQRIFKEHCINQFYLPAGVYEDECLIVPAKEELKCDICFTGGGIFYSHPEWPYRKSLVRFLQTTYGNRFKKYGYPERTVRGMELNEVYASSKIVIGDTLCKDFTDTHYYSDRQFEVTGRGGFLINPYIAGITDLFIDRKEIVLYGYNNFTQLRNLIDYYLIHEEEREDIRVAGHLRTKRDHTYTNRMQTMLQILKEHGAIQ
jgi:hypothetical protein